MTRSPIDPDLRRHLDRQSADAGMAARLDGPAGVRMARALMRMALEARGAIAGLPNGVQTHDLDLDGDPPLRLRLYRPPGAGPEAALPVLVYLHGGGWVVGSIDTHDPFCRLLCAAAEMLIVAVEYRLAPEHPYPAALEDALTALRWAASAAAAWGGDPQRLALGGDSAGGNLAAVTANRLCDSEAPPAAQLRAIVLLYPVLDAIKGDHPSHHENAHGFGLESELEHWFWSQYAPGTAGDDPGVAPLRIPRIPALPPTLIATAEYDLLRDEGIAWRDRLRAAGRAVTHLHAPDMHHDFPVHPSTVSMFPKCDATLQAIAAWLRATLAPAAGA